MDFSAVDWRLTLEFVRALAQPTATVLAVLAAALLSLRAFRRQKSLERRLEWYNAMVEQLHNTSSAYSRASLPAGEKERYKLYSEAVESGTTLIRLATRAEMYAEPGGYAAVAHLLSEFRRVVAHDPTPEIAEIVSRICRSASYALARETRKDLGLKEVPMNYELVVTPKRRDGRSLPGGSPQGPD